MTRAAVLTGSNLDLLPQIPDNSIDAIVTDPPYGLAFMGRDWDKALPDPRTWAECFRVLKPGGHMVAFGAPRLYHRLAVQIEDSAPWELRDCIMWLYGSGFPKNHDVSKAIDKAAGAEREVVGVAGRSGKGRNAMAGDFAGVYHETAPATDAAAQWEGWGTALKPAWEPILLARKPLDGTVARNVLAHGTGAINVDACRVGTEGGTKWADQGKDKSQLFGMGGCSPESIGKGRWPANLILDEEAGAALDAQTGDRKSGGAINTSSRGFGSASGSYMGGGHGDDRPWAGYSDSGGASRFFYCAKASRAEREEGLDHLPAGTVSDGRAKVADNAYQRGATVRRNRHPTVKPIDLMRYLVRLITPPGGIVLDPFTGSGTTGAAAVLEGFQFLGMELDPDHAEVSRARIAHHTPGAG